MNATRHAWPQDLRISTATTVAFVAALLVAVIGCWQLDRSRDVALAHASQEAGNLAKALAQHAARTIEGVDLVLTGLKERLLNPDRTTLKGFLERRAGALPQIHKLMVLAPDGTWIEDSVGPHPPLSSADRSYFVWHREHDDLALHIDLPFVSHYDGALVLPLSRRLSMPDGRFDGVVSATLRLDLFRNFYEQFRLGQDTAITLWSDTGRILIRHPEAPGMIGRDLSGARLFVKELRAGPSGVYRNPSASVDGLERIVGFQRLDRYPLLVATSMSVEGVLTAWRHEALPQVLVLALSIVALAALGTGLELRHRRMAASERATKDAQALFRGLFENTTDSLFVHRVRPDGDYPLEACNPAAAAAMGLPIEAVVGRSPENLFTPERAAIVRLNLDRVSRSGELLRVEDDTVLGNGHKCWEVIHVPLRDGTDGAVTRIFAGVRDITHLKQAEARVREANRLLMMAEQVAHVGHWHIALPSQALTWSDEVYRIYGLDPATFDPSVATAIAAYHPDDRERIAACVTEAIERQQSFEAELPDHPPLWRNPKHPDARSMSAHATGRRDQRGHIDFRRLR